MANPKATSGDATRRRIAFLEPIRMIGWRVGVFASLPFAALERAALKRWLDRIGAEGPALPAQG